MATEIEIKIPGDNFILPLSAEIMRRSRLKEGEKIKNSAEIGKIETRSSGKVELEAKVDQIHRQPDQERRTAYERPASGTSNE